MYLAHTAFVLFSFQVLRVGWGLLLLELGNVSGCSTKHFSYTHPHMLHKLIPSGGTDSYLFLVTDSCRAVWGQAASRAVTALYLHTWWTSGLPPQQEATSALEL